jgi:uncharacterized LabA/DUF88 family protein
MPKRIAVLIDGGYLRVLSRRAGHTYNPDFIEKFAVLCKGADEEIFRILYYDCAPYTGQARLPVSGTMRQFGGSDEWLKELSRKDLFAVRGGVLKFRGFKPKNIPVTTTGGPPVQDTDFSPDFEQKGVDMRIGLDIALFSDTRSVDRIVLVSNDTDCIPAMKHGRKAGLQVVIVELPGGHVAPELLSHADFKRPIAWPTP